MNFCFVLFITSSSSLSLVYHPINIFSRYSFDSNLQLFSNFPSFLLSPPPPPQPPATIKLVASLSFVRLLRLYCRETEIVLCSEKANSAVLGITDQQLQSTAFQPGTILTPNSSPLSVEIVGHQFTRANFPPTQPTLVLIVIIVDNWRVNRRWWLWWLHFHDVVLIVCKVVSCFCWWW